MPTVAEFRSALAAGDPSTIVEQWLLTPGAARLVDADIEYIQHMVCAAYGSRQEDVQIFITGSAKLGFSIVEKRLRDKAILPRYRLFGANSDIDVAIVSPAIFGLVWSDLSAYSHRAVRFPWAAERLGDYLVCGWLRPDHFPKGSRLLRCDLWWDTFRKLSVQARFERHAVRGGLFYSKEHLASYLARAVKDCIAAEVI